MRAGGGGIGISGMLRPVFVAVGQHLQELLCRRRLRENGQRGGISTAHTQTPRQPDTEQPWRLRLRHPAALRGSFQLVVPFAASQEPCRQHPLYLPTLPVSSGHAFAFRTGVGAALPRPCAHFYTHLVEGETLNHNSFLRILPDGQRALGLQQVVNLFVVHLEQETRCMVEVWFPSREELCTPASRTTWCPPPNTTSGTSLHREHLMVP